MSDLVRSIYYRRRQRKNLFLVSDGLGEARSKAGSLVFNEESVELKPDSSGIKQIETEVKKDIDSM